MGCLVNGAVAHAIGIFTVVFTWGVFIPAGQRYRLVVPIAIGIVLFTPYPVILFDSFTTLVYAFFVTCFVWILISRKRQGKEKK